MALQENFELIYCNVNSTYSPGDTITGKLFLTVVEPMKVRGIRVTFFGKAQVKWMERLQTDEGDKKETETVEQSAEEIYFNERQLIWGEDVDSDHCDVLPVGTREFPFNFRLPTCLPSSFESRHGYVRYYARATIDKPWKKDDHAERSFTVLGQLDLGQSAMATDRFEHSAEERVCCGCCNMGTFGVTLSMESRGFLVGDKIELKAHINNNTRNSCVSHLLLKMTLNLRSTDKVKVEEVVISQTSHVTNVGKTETWLASLQIPDVPPSGLAGCRIIDPKYIVQFSMEPSGFNCDSIELSAGIIIGTSHEKTKKTSIMAPKVKSEEL